MFVWHVVQHVSRDNNTSYRVGVNWIESHDSESEAATKCDAFNRHRSPQCHGVEYSVIGPVDESEPFSQEQ